MRKTHLVGAWPGISAPQAIEAALDRLGPHLLRLSDGETDDRRMWTGPLISWARVNPDLERVRVGDWTNYDSGPLYRIKEGRTMDPANIKLLAASAFRHSFPAFKVLRDEAGQPDLRFQVGMPAPIDLAVNTFGFPAAMADHSIAGAYAQATVGQIHEILAEADEPVVFQLETVVSLVAVAGAPAEAKAGVAAQMAGALHQIVAASPEGTHFGAHLCLGDYHHKALAEMTDAEPLVLLANAFAAGFPEGRILDYIHAPFAAASKPGSFDESWYRPLEQLDLPADVRFAAGFVHEDIAPKDHRKLLEMIERFAGREVDIAAACGLGRRPDPAQAWDAMDKSVALIEGA